MNTKIIVCYHKNFPEISNEILMPIHVGKEISDINIPFAQSDNTGINISDKHDYYSELTGLYWLWKNVNADVYGLFHYRRFLDFNNKYHGILYPSKIDTSDWNTKVIAKLLDKYDIIMPKKFHHKTSIYDYYKKNHHIKDLDTIIKIISKDYPQYTPYIEPCLKEHSGYLWNIFIMKKAIFNEYCSWLFDILSKVENEIDLENRCGYQQRVLGFLAERMMNIFIAYKLGTDKNLKLKHVNIIQLENEPLKHIKFGIGEFIDFPQKILFNIFGIKLWHNKK